VLSGRPRTGFITRDRKLGVVQRCPRVPQSAESTKAFA
jgi:hypothetical protein